MIRATHSSGRLLSFVLASVCLHGALLIGQRASVPRLPGQPETILSVSLTDAPEQVPAPTLAQDPPRRSNVPRSTPTPTPPAAETPATITPIPTAVAAPRDAADAPERHRQTARAQIRAQLLTDLARHFEYPLLARRRGWEGTVWLAFVVAPNGALEHIHVARGSGYDALDHSAVNALHRVGRLHHASHWLGGDALQMQLPVIYRLQEP